MSSRRLLKAAAAIREVVSMAILTELRDPRISDVTVTFVEVAPDMRSAKVHVSIMGNESKQNLSLRGLQNAAGFLQQKLSDRIDTRYTPRLQFVLDKGVKNSIAVSRILSEVLPSSPNDVEGPNDVEPTDIEEGVEEESDREEVSHLSQESDEDQEQSEENDDDV